MVQVTLPISGLATDRSPWPLYRAPFVILLLASGCGVLLDLAFGWSWKVWYSLVAVAVAAAWLRKWRRFTTLCCVVFCAGGWHAIHDRNHHADDIVIWTSQQRKPLIIEGAIDSQIEHHKNDSPYMRKSGAAEWSAHLDIRVLKIRHHFDWISASGRARLVVDGRMDSFLYGDRVELLCTGLRPGPPSNPGEPDLRAAFRQSRTLVRLHAEDLSHVRLIEKGSWSLQRALSWLSRRGEMALEACVSGNIASLASAIVLGRRTIDEPLRDHLVATGTVHIAVVSGLHLGLLAVALGFMADGLGWSSRIRVLAIVAGCSFYALITGWRPPVVRALILVLVVLLGRQYGRRGDSLHLLAAATVFLLIVNPAWLEQVGTQLSILAVAGLILAERQGSASEPIDPVARLISARRPAWVRWIGLQWQACNQRLRQSAWVMLLTTPLIWHHFHVVSLIALLANLLVSPLLLVALLSGICCAVLGGIWIPLGLPAGWICRIVLYGIDAITNWLSSLPGSHLWSPGPPKPLLITYYLAVALVILLFKQRRPLGLAIVATIWYSAAIIHELQSSTPSTMTVTFVDVGHGTSVLLQPPEGLPWLYDAGRMGPLHSSARPIEAVLWRARVRRFGLFISHADADHYCAIPSLLKKFTIDCVVVPPGIFDRAPPLLQEIENEIRSQKIPLLELTAGDHLDSSILKWSNSKSSLPEDQKSACGPSVRVLHPPQSWVKGKDNAASLTLEITYQGTTLILPGDLEPPGTDAVLRQPRPAAGSILMAPHHGSLSSDPLPLVEWSRPDTIVVSGGPRALRPEVQQRLESVGSRAWITARDGAIRIQWTAEGFQVQGFLHNPW